jgi:hypothetical protein
MDDPFDTEDVIGHSSVTGSTVAGLLNSLQLLLGCNIKWKTLDNLATPPSYITEEDEKKQIR